jgi:hypothetical protein
MSDDLVKRLRQSTGLNAVTQEPVRDKLKMAAANRIEELETQITAMEEGLTAVHMAGYMDGRRAAEAKLKSMAMDNIAADLSSEVSADRIRELETKLDRASKMLFRALSAIYKDRKQEVIDVLETAIAEITGGKDD